MGLSIGITNGTARVIYRLVGSELLNLFPTLSSSYERDAEVCLRDPGEKKTGGRPPCMLISFDIDQPSFARLWGGRYSGWGRLPRPPRTLRRVSSDVAWYALSPCAVLVIRQSSYDAVLRIGH